MLEQDWRDHKPKRPYDAVVSVGAFEHFVQKGLEPARKLETYREFFAFCDGALVTGGRMSLQTIAYSEPHKVHPLLEETFPESDLPLFWEPVAAAEGRFQLVAMRNDGDDYVRTLRLWEQSLFSTTTKPSRSSARPQLRNSAATFGSRLSASGSAWSACCA